MPLYEYLCKSCENQFEVLVRTASSDPTPSCPDCGARDVRKVFSLVAARPARGHETPAPAAPRASFGGGCCGGACGCGH
jgi:putative FmdB family regulatory protein